MKAKIISIDKVLFEGDASSVTVPGITGEVEILDNHADSFFQLKAGNVLLNRSHQIQINGGLCKTIKGSLTILSS